MSPSEEANRVHVTLTAAEIEGARLMGTAKGQVALIRRAERILFDGLPLLGEAEAESDAARFSTAITILHSFVERFERGEFVRVTR